MNEEKATIILFSGNLDKALACFNIATTAAALGLKVTIFFTFWGLSVVAKPGSRAKKGLIKKAFSLINRSGTRTLKLSRFNFAGLGTFLIKRLMKKENMFSLEELVATAKSQGVKFVACTTTCSLMGLSRENLIPEVDEMAGAATFVEEAKNSKFTLFI